MAVLIHPSVFLLEADGEVPCSIPIVGERTVFWCFFSPFQFLTKLTGLPFLGKGEPGIYFSNWKIEIKLHCLMISSSWRMEKGLPCLLILLSLFRFKKDPLGSCFSKMATPFVYFK